MSDDGVWYFERGYNAATPTHYYYLFFKEIPSTVGFGQMNSPDQMFYVRKGSPLLPGVMG